MLRTGLNGPVFGCRTSYTLRSLSRGITDRQKVGIRHCTGLSPRAPSALELVSNHRPKPTRNKTYGSWARSSSQETTCTDPKEGERRDSRS